MVDAVFSFQVGNFIFIFGKVDSSRFAINEREANL
jgi:hypothetical protein